MGRALGSVWFVWRGGVGRSKGRTRAGTSRGVLCLVLAVVAAVATVGLTATSSAALNGSTYNVIKNADRHQYCLDIDTTFPGVAFAEAQLWTCTKGQEQQFIRLDGILPNTFRIKIENGGGQYCLGVNDFSEGSWLVAVPCGNPSWVPEQSWTTDGNGNLVAHGNIIDPGTRLCADTFPHDQLGAHVELMPCNVNSISQRWFL